MLSIALLATTFLVCKHASVWGRLKHFRELSRRGRLRRFQSLAETALASYGPAGARLRFIQYGENIIYRVDAPGPPSLDHTNRYVANRYVLRILASSDVNTIAWELTRLAALNREAGLPPPAPVSTPDCKLLATILTPGIPQGHIVSLMRWLDGQRLHQGLRPRHLAALGQVAAQMHAFSAAWQVPAGFRRPVWDWDTQLGGSMFRHSREELVASMPSKFEEPFLVVAQKAKRVMECLGKGRDAFGLIHSDLYPESVLFKAGKAYPIDFEDCGFGYWM